MIGAGGGCNRNRNSSTMCIHPGRILVAAALCYLLSSSTSSFLCLAAKSADSLSPVQSINGSQTLLSSGGAFALGFFRAGRSGRHYLGIWHTSLPKRIVWVANRQSPIEDNMGRYILELTEQGQLRVVVTNGSAVVWTSSSLANNELPGNPVARLTDSGNLVVVQRRGQGNNTGVVYLWQSFEHPTDTILPGMKIGVDLRTGVSTNLTSWRSRDDPAPGDYTMAIDVHGEPQLVLYHGSDWLWRIGPWTGEFWSGSPTSKMLKRMAYNISITNDEVWYSFYMTKDNLVTSLVVNQSTGQITRWLWSTESRYLQTWSNPSPNDRCSEYRRCRGANQVCKNGMDGGRGGTLECACVEEQHFQRNDEGDCVRKTPLRKDDCKAADGGGRFLVTTGLNLPDTSRAVARDNASLEECKAECTRNCSCTAYAALGRRGCLMWFGDLVDLRTQTLEPFDVYVRVEATNGKKNVVVPAVITIAVCLVLGLLLILGCAVFRFLRRKKSTGAMDGYDGIDGEEMYLPVLDFDTLAAATDNFSVHNKLGEGGFGSVYMGTLRSKEEVAVKRLSAASSQGVREFKNEVNVIAKLQHRNLVRLLACCVHGGERMLVYEFMPNKSLDYFLFPKCRRDEESSSWAALDWPSRDRIINGIARGMLYLHQDSRLRIIHRDLKASNVLLDAHMNPKISDFGTARIFLGDEATHDNVTHRVVGTHGYMSPEYAMDGVFSVKSDVFSFGVLVLEIVSGRRNKAVFRADTTQNLIGLAWTHWSEGRVKDLADPYMERSCESEAKKMVKIGLLCVQDRPDDRPTMTSVVVMLNGNAESIPDPKEPVYAKSDQNPLFRMSSSPSSAVNNVDYSTFVGR